MKIDIKEVGKNPLRAMMDPSEPFTTSIEIDPFPYHNYSYSKIYDATIKMSRQFQCSDDKFEETRKLVFASFANELFGDIQVILNEIRIASYGEDYREVDRLVRKALNILENY